MAFVMMPTGTAAQDRDPSSDLSVSDQAINLVKQRLDFLIAVNREFPDQKLEQYIGEIEVHIQRAETAIANRQSRIAKLEIAAAQQLIKLAAQVVLRGPLTSLREQLEEKIRQLEQLLQRSFRQDVQKLLQNAKKNKEQAELALRSGNQTKALELFRIALSDAEKALSLISSVGGDDLVRGFYEEKANFEQLAHRLQDSNNNRLAASSTDRSQNFCLELYKQAVDQQKKAESAFSRGEFKQAIDLYRWGTRLLLRAIDLCQPTDTPADAVATGNLERLAADELHRTKEMLDSVQDNLDADQTSQTQQIYRRANRVYADAVRSYQSGQYRNAIGKVNLTKLILNRLRRMTGESMQRPSDRLDQEIDLLQNLIGNLEGQIESANRPIAKRILTMARQYLDEGVTANEAGRPLLATARLFAATKFALGAKALLSNDVSLSNLAEESLSAFGLFEQKHNEIQGRLSGHSDEFAGAWLAMETEIYQYALQARDAGRYPLLLQNSRIGLEILQDLERRLKEQGI